MNLRRGSSRVSSSTILRKWRSVVISTWTLSKNDVYKGGY
jgi:hypothetical protein